MPGNSEKFTLAFDVEMEMRKAAQKVVTFEKQLQKLTKEPAKFEKGQKHAFSAFSKELIKSQKGTKKLQMAMTNATKNSIYGRDAKKQFKELEKSFHAVEDASDVMKETLAKHRQETKAAENRLRKASTDGEKKAAATAMGLAKDTAEEKINQSRLAYKKAKENLDKGIKESGASKTLKKESAGVADQSKTYEKDMKAAAGRAADAMKFGMGNVAHDFSLELLGGVNDAIDSLGSRDLKGVGLGLGKGLVKALQTGAKGIGKVAESHQDKGGAAGAMSKGILSMSKTMAPLIDLISKMGPMLSMSASIIAGIVKVMIDAEAQAKQFNKDIMESSSSMEFLAANGGNAQDAFRDLDKTLDEVRGAAFDAQENMKWGITAETHKALVNTLAQEGLGMRSLTHEFQNAKKAAEGTASAVEDFGDLTHMSITYSRMFGTSLNDIGQFQAQMFTEMGTSLSGMQLQFSRMGQDAAESGIAANKFFAIIRNVSSDLALYNTRLEQTSSILKLLGKAMSPKNASKFLTTMAQGMKGLSEEDRIKQMVIAGPGANAEVAKDLERKQTKMYEDVAKELSTAGKKVLGSDVAKDFEGAISGLDDKKQGAFREAQAEMNMDKNALDKGGAFGAGEAASNASMAATFAIKKLGLQRIGGHKKLSEMTGASAFGARKSMGMGLEEFRGMAKMETMIDDQRKSMQDALSARKSGGPVSADQQKILDRLDASGVKDVSKDSDVIAGMEQTAQAALAASLEQKNFAEETAKATQSISDKMETVISGIFEFIYEALKDVIRDLNEFMDLIASAPGFKRKNDPEKQARAILRNGKTKEGAGVSNAMKAAMDGPGAGDAMGKMMGAVGPMLAKGLVGASAGTVKDDILSVVNGGKFDNAKSASVAEGMNLDAGKKKTFQDALNGDKNMSVFGAAQKAGFTEDDMKLFLQKSMWGMGPEDLAKIAPGLKTMQAGAGTPGSPTAAVSGQATAAQAANTPGSQGAPGAPPPTAAPPTKVEAQQISTATDLVSLADDTNKALTQKGTVMNKSFMKTQYMREMELAVTDGTRKSLAEFALYTAKDPAKQLEQMKMSGFDVGGVAKQYEDTQKLVSHANGSGAVSGVSNGMAVFAAANEGLASIGKGERILPAHAAGTMAGAGSTNVTLNVNGIGGQDLANYLRDRVSELIYEYKRREKFVT